MKERRIMSRVFVTIVIWGKKTLSVGDTVRLVKDPTNSYDSDAVKVFKLGSDVFLGYIANSPSTVTLGSKSATEIQSLFEDKAKAQIVNKTTVTTQTGRRVTAYIAELVLNEKELAKGSEIKMANTQIKVKIIGSVTLYPNKMLVLEQLKKGLNPTIKLVHNGDKILAYYDGGLCGYIDNRKQEGIYTYEEVKDLIKEEKLATVVSQSRQNYIAVFTANEKEELTKVDKKLDEILERIIAEGIATKEELDERIDYMRLNKVTEKQMATLFNTYKKYDEDVTKKIPNPKTKYQDSQGLVKKSIAYINMGRNVLFQGERGVGKNVLLETLAWLYKRPLYEFAMNSQHDNNSLLGGKTFADIEEETKEESLSFFNSMKSVVKKGFGLKHIFSASKEEDALEVMDVFKKLIGYFTGNKKIKYDPDIIVQAAEVGGFLELGEFNTGFGHVISILNSLLDDRRRLHVPGYKTVVADSNFVAVATQNLNYTGTFENNEATIDRFVPIVFPPLNTIEPIIVSKVPGISSDVVRNCQMLYEGIKRCVKNGQIHERTVSIRGFIDACLVTLQDMPLKEALIDNIANRATDSDERKVIINMIEDILG